MLTAQLTAHLHALMLFVPFVCVQLCRGLLSAKVLHCELRLSVSMACCESVNSHYGCVKCHVLNNTLCERQLKTVRWVDACSMIYAKFTLNTILRSTQCPNLSAQPP